MSTTIATWGDLKIEILSDEIIQVIDNIKSFLELLNQALDLVLQVAEIVKTFVTSNLNLAKALVKEILDTLRRLIQDFFKLGFYYNFGDHKIIAKGYPGLKGGYPAYERRMMTRLNDRQDPNRPDFTASSTVLALFYYVGVDLSFIDDILDSTRLQPLIRCLRSFAALLGFSLDGNTALPVASNLRVEYSTDTTLDVRLAWSNLLGRTRAKIVWGIAPAPGGSEQDPNPPVPPGGFLVEVSCYPKGFQVGWLAPAPAGTSTGSDNSNQPFITGTYQASTTGRPLVIFGGVDTIDIGPDVSWPDPYDPSAPLKTGYHPAYFFQDQNTPEVIRKPFGKGTDAAGQEVYYNQRAFFVDSSFIKQQFFSGGNYYLDLNPEELPKYCPIVDGQIDTSNPRVPDVVYVRVTPVSDLVTADNYKEARWVPRPHTSDNETLVHIHRYIVPDSGGEFIKDDDLGIPSTPLEVAVPSASRDLYGLAVQTAIAVLTLSRSDITPPDETTTATPNTTDPTYVRTGLEGTLATEISRLLGIINPDNYYGWTSFSPDEFIRDLYPRIVTQADRYIQAQGSLPQDILDALEPTLRTLVDWKWSDTNVSGARGNPALNYTILGSLRYSAQAPDTTPLCRNRRSLRSMPSETAENLFIRAGLDYEDSGFGTVNFRGTLGAADFRAEPSHNVRDCAPVVGPSNTTSPDIWYARHLISEEVYNAASTVLAITPSRTVETGTWGSKKLFLSRAPVGRVLDILNKVESFTNVLFAGLQSSTDAILRFITFLEQRVREVQEFIRRIEEFLDIPFSIPFPSMKVLLLTTNGTSGVISGFLSAENKPPEGAKGYGGGGVLVAGSAPTLLVELLTGWVKAEVA